MRKLTVLHPAVRIVAPAKAHPPLNQNQNQSPSQKAQETQSLRGLENQNPRMGRTKQVQAFSQRHLKSVKSVPGQRSERGTVSSVTDVEQQAALAKWKRIRRIRRIWRIRR